MNAVVVLFVRADSIYKTLPGVECYDEARDARTWPGGCPVVAHPPCRTWGSLKHFATAAPAHEHALGPWAVDQVRRWGGVLEHPKGSTLFRECGCALPGGLPDEWGGMTLEVDQFHWGHKARKRTLLYVVGTRDIPTMPRRAGKPTHVVDRPGRARKAERPNSAGLLPWVSHKEREATPPAFAAWLVELARRCSKHNANLERSTRSGDTLRDFVGHPRHFRKPTGVVTTEAGKVGLPAENRGGVPNTAVRGAAEPRTLDGLVGHSESEGK